jgi:hypothetical protein
MRTQINQQHTADERKPQRGDRKDTAAAVLNMPSAKYENFGDFLKPRSKLAIFCLRKGDSLNKQRVVYEVSTHVRKQSAVSLISKRAKVEMNSAD